jgi:hypothetical protein
VGDGLGKCVGEYVSLILRSVGAYHWGGAGVLLDTTTILVVLLNINLDDYALVLLVDLYRLAPLHYF